MLSKLEVGLIISFWGRGERERERGGEVGEGMGGDDEGSSARCINWEVVLVLGPVEERGERGRTWGFRHQARGSVRGEGLQGAEVQADAWLRERSRDNQCFLFGVSLSLV